MQYPAYPQNLISPGSAWSVRGIAFPYPQDRRGLLLFARSCPQVGGVRHGCSGGVSAFADCVRLAPEVPVSMHTECGRCDPRHKFASRRAAKHSRRSPVSQTGDSPDPCHQPDGPRTGRAGFVMSVIPESWWASVTDSAISTPVADDRRELSWAARIRQGGNSEFPGSPENSRRAAAWEAEVERVVIERPQSRPERLAASRRAERFSTVAARTAGCQRGFSRPVPSGGLQGCHQASGFSRLPGREAGRHARASPVRGIEGFCETVRKNSTGMGGETVNESEIAALEADVQELADEVAEFAALMQRAARELGSLARRCGLPSSASE